ncbi:flagellar biosynthesis protein FlhF [Paenibacillus eucommiae]|uniref:Flagellar biosynthesis protein FlhF n=1 Tax=Paenibacillus eucommiae TaxID=1355755 RepID=A0ABS4IUR3_9BACL|nr:flagellar biosynthesis protein FlhF [Paenibacillus eucommiae]MBP1991320.1 flagellar biosynthesis protein FlhF [Paenibacillus eucommiae]
MRVKRYVVDSMPDALQKIRSDLGKDAVILNTKEIRSGGFLGMFGKKKIEVIAATDTGGGEGTNASSGAKPAAAIRPAAAVVRPAPATAPAQALAVLTQEKRSDFPEVPDVLHTYTPPKAASHAPRPQEELLLEEIKQMKEMMKNLTFSAKDEPKLPEPLAKIEHRLLEQEVDHLLVKQLMEQALEESLASGEEISEQAAESSIRKQLQEMFHTDSSKQISAATRVVHFVGPTGVGKTTTIAKLAAEQVLKFHRKVGFITSDTYRIAAIEQLKTYATILNVPIEVVFSPQDLSKAFRQLEACDIIFMDTAGRNFRNEMYVSELNALLQTQGNSETILVLSLTTKYKDMKAITNNFNKFKLDKVLFTKMDETDSYGAIVNLIHDFSLQLSYVTNGQNVPDDITEISEQHIIDLLLEESVHD